MFLGGDFCPIDPAVSVGIWTSFPISNHGRMRLGLNLDRMRHNGRSDVQICEHVCNVVYHLEEH